MSSARRLSFLVGLSLLLGACATAEGPGAGGMTTSLSPEVTAAPPTTEEPSDASSDLLSAIRSRGRLICGIDGALPGFSLAAGTGDEAGFDVEMCRAVATALFGAREAVRFVEVPAGGGGDALRSGSVDLVSSQTAWEPDVGSLGPGVAAGPAVFYDGVQLMGRAVDGVTPEDAVDAIAGLRVCTAPDANGILEEVVAVDSIEASIQPFESAGSAVEAFKSGDCDVVAALTTELVVAKTVEPEGAGWVVFPTEALAPTPSLLAHRAGESDFADVLSLVVRAMVEAEAQGVSSDTVTDAEAVPPVLEVPAEAGDEWGIAPNAFVQVIRQVGNYAEVFERHLGVVGLERGVNALVRDGGLLESPG